MAVTSAPVRLDTVDVTTLKGVGAAMAEKLKGLGIHHLQDVLFHLPFRYQDRTQLVPIGSLQPGREGVVSGEVAIADVVTVSYTHLTLPTICSV